MALQSEKVKGKLAMVTAGKVQYEVMISYDAEDADVASKLKGPVYFLLFYIFLIFKKKMINREQDCGPIAIGPQSSLLRSGQSQLGYIHEYLSTSQKKIPQSMHMHIHCYLYLTICWAVMNVTLGGVGYESYDQPFYIFNSLCL